MTNINVRLTPQLLVKMLMALSLVYIVFLPIRANIILRTIRIISFLIIYLLAIRLLPRQLTRSDLMMYSSLFTIGLLIFCGFIVYDIQLTMENIIVVLSLFSLLMLVSIADRISLDSSMITYTHYCGVFIAVIQLVYSQTRYAYWTGERYSRAFTMGINNPNTTAIYLFFSFSLLLLTMKKMKIKWVAILLEIGLMWLIWKTGCRMIVVAAVILILVSITGRNKRVPAMVVWGLCSSSYLFFSFYIWLFNKGIDNISVLGKPLFTGRQRVYAEEYLPYINSTGKILFGNLGGNMFQNAHNGPLSILTAIGVVGLIAFSYIMMRAVRKAYRKVNGPVSNTAMVAILSCFVHACGESTLFLGGYPSVVFIFILFLIAGSSEMDMQGMIRERNHEKVMRY